MSLTLCSLSAIYSSELYACVGVSCTHRGAQPYGTSVRVWGVVCGQQVELGPGSGITNMDPMHFSDHGDYRRFLRRKIFDREVWKKYLKL